jgi:hypothetical protein
MEEKNLVCPNKGCGKVFAKPLKTIKLHQSSKEYHNNCPYCLTEITINEIESKNPHEKTAVETTLSEEEPSKRIEKSFSCKYHPGYLSEREHKQQIPEECMVCMELIECMQKKITT